MAETAIERIQSQQQPQQQAPSIEIPTSTLTPPQPGHMQNLSELTTEQASLLAMMSQVDPRLGIQIPSSQQSLSLNTSPTSALMQPPIYEAVIPSILGAAPLGKVPLTKDQLQQLALLEAAHKKLPQPSDNERIRTYLQRQPHTTPYYFPIMPPPSSDSLDFVCKLSCENLFFMFYYMEVRQSRNQQAIKTLKSFIYPKY
jgi:CCR4-NOT transcription complex subunit 3